MKRLMSHSRGAAAEFMRRGPELSTAAGYRPAQFRGQAFRLPPTPQLNRSRISSAFDLFHDPVLTALLKTALSQNNDLQIAAERVFEARSQYGITRSAIFPSLDARANSTPCATLRLAPPRLFHRV